MADSLHEIYGQRHQTHGHCTEWIIWTEATQRWPLYCVEYRYRCNIGVATALNGAYGQV